MSATSSAPAVTTSRVPGDKSFATRALLLALLVPSRSTVRRAPKSRTTNRVVDVVRALGGVVDVVDSVGDVFGVDVSVDGRGFVGARRNDPQQEIVHRPVQKSSAPIVLTCGGSATLARIVLGLVAGAGIDAVVTGSEMLSRRPMTRVKTPVAALLGDDVITLTDGHLPATVRGVQPGERRAVRQSPTSLFAQHESAQVRSAIAYAALATGAPVMERAPLPAHWRRSFEDLLRDTGQRAGHALNAFDVDVVGDPSAAAFVVALAVGLGAGVVIEDVVDADDRAGLLSAVRLLGATVTTVASTTHPARSVDVHIAPRTAPLHGVTLPSPTTPLSTFIDEVPVLALLCTLAQTPSRLTGLAELRVKESDRVTRTAAMLKAFGADVEEVGDDLVIAPAPLRAPTSTIVTDHDHRIGMTALVLGAILGVDVVLDDHSCVDESWPGFAAFLAALATTLRARLRSAAISP